MTRSHRIDVGPLGPLIGVGLNVGATRARLGLGEPPQSSVGLIDTGASRTAISHAVHRALQPAACGSSWYQRPGGRGVRVDRHAIRLDFEGHLSSNPWFGVEVVVADPATPGVDVLIGMDVISRLVVFYEGVKGTMILAY